MKKQIDYSNQNEFTLYSFDYNDGDKLYFQKILIKLASICPNLQVSSIRTADNLQPMLEKLYEFENEFSYLRYDENWIDLAGNKMDFTGDLAAALVDLWYSFENNAFVFYQASAEHLGDDSLSNLVLDSCENAIQRTKCYFLTGGGVRDLVKIYKSNGLTLDFLFSNEFE
ncbi:hypothetical protein OHD16_17215 [Sphingobacterium sp. ML3W]|uniref:hypothetical protein n=1 Tax=Sphingobacterium sp. ML3W TaxID=1538644 RepID=UPI00249BF065|nr:hypothetical protein [Sphingobacterium sp. ML3W]WFA81696.1 hypothetical protein OGI71_10355 [Sphingobacterium sp. ML3W]